MHMPGEFYDYSCVFRFWYCSRKGTRLAKIKERRKKERKKKEKEVKLMTKLDFHRF